MERFQLPHMNITLNGKAMLERHFDERGLDATGGRA